MAAETAEQLMRARYCAYAKHLGSYIERTWDPSTRPEVIELSDDLRWTGLEIVRCIRGRREDTAGIVEFRAHHSGRHGDGSLGEVSSFRRVGSSPEGEWVYLGVAR
ncbi:MAG: YchJ family metal-binding protein [Microthrixaceae bacterium]